MRLVPHNSVLRSRNGFGLTEVIIAGTILGIALASYLVFTGQTTKAKQSALWRSHMLDLKLFVNRQIDCQRTLATAGAACAADTTIPGLKADNSVFIAAPSQKVGEVHEVRVRCGPSYANTGLVVQGRRLDSFDHTKVATDPFNKKSMDWQDLYNGIPFCGLKAVADSEKTIDPPAGFDAIVDWMAVNEAGQGVASFRFYKGGVTAQNSSGQVYAATYNRTTGTWSNAVFIDRPGATVDYANESRAAINNNGDAVVSYAENTPPRYPAAGMDPYFGRAGNFRNSTSTWTYEPYDAETNIPWGGATATAIEDGTGNAVAIKWASSRINSYFFDPTAAAGAGAWGGRVTVETGIVHHGLGREYDVTSLGPGRFLAVWVGGRYSTQGYSDIFAMFALNGAWQGNAIAIDNTPHSPTRNNLKGARVVGTPDGKAMAVWQNRGDDGTTFLGTKFFANYYDGAAWTGETVLATAGSGQYIAGYPGLAGNNAGYVIAGWLEGKNVVVRRFVPGAGAGTGWQPAEIMDSDPAAYENAYTPQVAINQSGDMAVAWSSAKTCGSFTGASTKARRRINGAWVPALTAAPLRIDSAPCDQSVSSNPQVGIDGNGRTHFMWAQDNAAGEAAIHFREVD